MLEQHSVLKLNISITQDQFEKKYKSNGDFFILGSNEYFFDSSELKISLNHKNLVTKNYLNRQIVYSELDEGELNLFDVLLMLLDSLQLKHLVYHQEYEYLSRKI